VAASGPSPGQAPLERIVFGLAKRVVGPERWAGWRARYQAARHRRDDRLENRKWHADAPRMVVASEPTDPRHMYSYFLDWLGRERPELRRRIRVDRVPCAIPPGTTLFHAWVQDPVIERDARLHARLSEIEAVCAQRGITVVHPARVLSHSTRDVLWERLGRVGARTPRIAVVDGTFDEHRGRLALPMLVRNRWGHGEFGDLRKIDTEQQFAEWWRTARTHPAAWVAGEYIDVRDADGYYRKYRYVMAGARGVARHLIVSPKWEVRPADRVKTPATRAEELAFVNGPFPHQPLFDAARRALEFEIAAFDFSYDAAGQLIVWEVNPFPDLSTPPGEVGEYLRPAIERSYALLADFYVERGL
jgi:hypothetical protein